MPNRKLPYKKPEVQFWSAEELNAIEATMSGGPAIVDDGLLYYVTIVNNHLFPYNTHIAGHSAVLFSSSSLEGRCQLFSFAPPYNRDPVGARGVISTIVRPEDSRSFQAFCKACSTDCNSHDGCDFCDQERGVLIGHANGSMGGRYTWHEHFTRYIQLGVTCPAYKKMLALANFVMGTPPEYNFNGSSYHTGYNCQGFVNHVLSAAGIVLKTDVGVSLANNIVPNTVIETAQAVEGPVRTLLKSNM